MFINKKAQWQQQNPIDTDIPKTVMIDQILGLTKSHMVKEVYG